MHGIRPWARRPQGTPGRLETGTRVLDTAGGAAVFLNVYKQVKGKPRETQVKRISRNATIDLRVDYLRPGTGQVFTASAWILRAGNKFAVTRMELHNETDTLIAVGTGTYSLG